MTVHEEKKWLMSRIDQLHNALKNEFNSKERKFTDIEEKELAKLKGRRNDYLYIIGIVLTISVAIYTSNNDDVYLLGFIIGLILAGIVFMIMFGVYMTLTRNFMHMFIKEITTAEGIINHSNGFFTVKTYEFEKIEYEYLKNYLSYVRYLSVLCTIGMFTISQQAKKKKWLNPEIKEEFEEIEPYKQLIDDAIPKYENLKKDIPDSLLDQLFEQVIADYKKLFAKKNSQKPET